MSELPEPGKIEERLLSGQAGTIQAILSSPRQPRPEPVGAIVCHPHPLFGGEMTNKVTYMLASTAQKAGCHTLRFNFRGVGRSQGRHDSGHGETDDVIHLAGWMREQLPGARILLMGFSFGAWVSVRAAASVGPLAQVSIAPPFGKYVGDTAIPARPPCPWLVVHGRDDEVVDYQATRTILEQYDPPPELVSLDGVGHFFHGRLTQLGEVVGEFLHRQLV